MKKKEIDHIVSKNFDHIEQRAQMFIDKSKLRVELDVVTWAYQEVIKKPDKLNTEEQVIARMIQNCKMATIWSNSGYHSKFSKKEVKLSDDYLSILLTQEEDQPRIIDDYLKQCSNDDRLLLSRMLDGFTTSGKLSKVTTIPKTTCYYMIKGLHGRIKDFVNKNKDKYNISNQ